MTASNNHYANVNQFRYSIDGRESVKDSGTDTSTSSPQSHAQVAQGHTPGPWSFHTQPFGDRISGGLDHSIQSEHGVVMLIVPPGIVTDEFEANAAFIVRACNAHDDMLAALKTALHAMQHSNCDSQAEDVVRDAIAKAEGPGDR